MTLREDALANSSGGSRNIRFAFINPRLKLAAAVGMLALAIAACGTGDASTSEVAAESDGTSVTIEDMAFEPETLTVEVGHTVTWVWNDGAVEHDVSGDDFHSEVMSEGTFRHRFDEPDTYEYVCTLHPNMTGMIEVTR